MKCSWLTSFFLSFKGPAFQIKKAGTTQKYTACVSFFFPLKKWAALPNTCNFFFLHLHNVFGSKYRMYHNWDLKIIQQMI